MSNRRLVVASLLIATIAGRSALSVSGVDRPGDGTVPLRGWQAPPYYTVPARPDSLEGARVDDHSPSPAAIATATLAFVGVTPCRVADTRPAPFGPFPPGEYGPPFMNGGVARSFTLTGQCSIPSDAEAVSFNFTVTNTGGPGFLLAFPAGGAAPGVSTLNYLASQTIANAAVVPLGPLGQGKGIGVVPGVSGFDLIIDVNGYYTAQGVVSSMNGRTGAVSITAGSNVTVTPSAQNIQVSAGPLVSSLEGLTGVVDVASSNGTTVSAGSSTLTLGTNATSSATASTIVSRDASAGFAAATIELAGSPNLLTTGGGTRLLHRTGDVSNFFFGPGAGGAATTGIFNTASGNLALASNTTGMSNTAFGDRALSTNVSGVSNSAFGASALIQSTGDQNSAFGSGALLGNTAGSANTAAGSFALTTNSTGGSNTAVGSLALQANSTGSFNTAVGISALNANSTGGSNTAVGAGALLVSTTASGSTAVGAVALAANTTGAENSAFGFNALTTSSTGNRSSAFGSGALLVSSTGSDNAGFGTSALTSLTTGSQNVAVGSSAGGVLTTGSNNIYLGYNVDAGGAAESNTIRIGNQTAPPTGGAAHTSVFFGGISGQTSTSGVAVLVNSSGKLGTTTSSRRYKTEIEDVGERSEVLSKLRPVTFLYREELDPERTRQYGLIAEEVAEVAPDLVVFGADGEPQTVRYHLLVPLLLDALKSQQRIGREQQLQIEQLQREVGALQAVAGGKR